MNAPEPISIPIPDHDNEIMRLLTSHQGMVYAYILSVHPNRIAAQDILQETNMVLWKKREQFELGTNFKAWAFRFAHFQTLAHLKRVKNKDWIVFTDQLVDTMGQEAAEEFEDFDDRSGALKSCLGKLPAAEQDLIRAHYQSGLSLADLSSRLGRKRGALKQALFRIRRCLRTCIERELQRHPPPQSLPNS